MLDLFHSRHNDVCRKSKVVTHEINFNDSVILDSVTVRQHAQYQDPETERAK